MAVGDLFLFLLLFLFLRLSYVVSVPRTQTTAPFLPSRSPTATTMKLHFSPSINSTTTPAFTPRLRSHVPTIDDNDLKTLLAWLTTDDDDPAADAAPMLTML
jgi:hypothetical protein